MSSIQVTIHTQTTLRAIMLSYCQCLFHYCSAITTGLRCAIGVDSDYVRTSIFAFVRKHIDENSPSCVMNAFRKTHLSQAFDVKVFVCNKIVGIYKLTRFFMKKVFALVGYPAMQCRQFSFCSLAFMNRILRLNFFKFILGHPVVSRIINYHTIRKNGERVKPKIDTNSISRYLLMNNKFIFNNQRAIPMAAGFSDSTCFYFSAINNATVLLDFYKSDFTKFQSITFNCKSGLRVCNRAVSVLGFKAWEARFLSLLYSTKEILKGFIDAFQNILQYLRVNLCECGYLFFDGRQFVGLLCKRHGLTNFFVSRYPMIQRCIVQPPANIELGFKDLSLLPCRVKSVFIGSNHYSKYKLKQSTPKG